MREQAEAPAAIATEGICKRFVVTGWLPGRPRAVVDALRGVDLRADAGTIHGIIGPNGSGKSTFLRILATLITPDGGTARVGGFDVVTQGRGVRGALGFTTGEERSVYWRLTARQNLEFAAALLHVVDAGPAIERALAIAELTDAADRPVSGFSQGMVRRLGLARAVLHRPPVLVLDEPTRSLDPVARDQLHQVLASLRDDHGVTTLLSTHDLGEARDVCDAVSVLIGGRIVDNLTGATERRLKAVLRKGATT